MRQISFSILMKLKVIKNKVKKHMEFPNEIWCKIVSYCKIRPEQCNNYFEVNKYYYNRILWEIYLFNYKIVLSDIIKIKITKKTKCFVWFIMYSTNIDTNTLCDYYEYNKEYKIRLENYQNVEKINLKCPIYHGSICLDSRNKINSWDKKRWNNYLKQNTIEHCILTSLRYKRPGFRDRKLIVKELLEDHLKYFNIKDETISLLQMKIDNYR